MSNPIFNLTSPPCTHKNQSIPMSSTSPALSSSPPPTTPISRCRGLDLLTMAVLTIDGDRAFDAQKPIVINSMIGLDSEEKKKKKKQEMGGGILQPQSRRGRHKALPSKFRDSVIQDWRRSSRRPRAKKIRF